MEKILLAQFIAHIIADFFVQPECFSRGKQNKCLGSWHIYVHILIVFVVSLALTPTCEFIWCSLAIAISHFIIDALKCITERRIKTKKGNYGELYTNHYIFFIDQILHMAVMYGAVVIYWGQTHSEPCCPGLFPVDRLLTLAGFLLCMKPANIVIRSCLSSLNLYDPSENENDLEKAGRWIGSIERIMAMVLVMLQQYTAIGFIIAAKSVLRYNDKKTGKTEYVLIGTLLSFGIAILIGIGIEKGFFEALLKYAADLWQ